MNMSSAQGGENSSGVPSSWIPIEALNNAEAVQKSPGEMRDSLQALMDKLDKIGGMNPTELAQKFIGLLDMLDKNQGEKPPVEMPLLEESKDVKKENGKLVIEVKDPTVTGEFVGSNGKSKAEELFMALTNKTEVKTDPKQNATKLDVVAVVPVGGKNSKVDMEVGFKQTAKGPKDEGAGTDELSFAPLNKDGKPDNSRRIVVKIERGQNPNGVPQTKVFLEIAQPKDQYKLGADIGEFAQNGEELANIENALRSLSGKNDPSSEFIRGQMIARRDAIQQSMEKSGVKEVKVDKDKQTREDLAKVVGLLNVKKGDIRLSQDPAAPLNDANKAQLSAIDAVRKVLDIPGQLTNPKRKQESREAEAPEAGLSDFLRQLQKEPNLNGNPQPARNPGEATPAAQRKTETTTQAEPGVQTAEAKALREKSKEELVAEFDKELDGLKKLNEEKSNLETKIAELKKAGTEVLSKEDKEKLTALEKELKETSEKIEIVKTLSDLGLLNFKSEKARTQIGTEVISPEDLANLSLARLYALLDANATALAKEIEKDKTKDQAKVDRLAKIKSIADFMLNTSNGTHKKFTDKEFKDQKGVDVVLAWLNQSLEKTNDNIKPFKDKEAAGNEKAALNETQIKELEAQLAEVNKKIAESETRAQAIIAALAGKMGTEEWLLLTQRLNDAHGGKFEGKGPEVPAQAEAQANAAIAANCLRKIDLDLEQRAEPETSKVKKFFKRAAEVLTSVFGGIAARTAVKAIVVGALGMTLGGPAGLLVGGLAGALAGGASSAIFGTWMHYKVFHNDKMHAVYAENANPGKMDIFRGKIYEKANEIYETPQRIKNIAAVYNSIVSGQLQPNQLNDEQKKAVMGVVKDSRFMKLTTNYIGVNGLGLGNDLFKAADGKGIAIEDGLRDFATRFDNFVNAAINSNQIAQADVESTLKSADDDAKAKVDQVITSASWTKFFKGALIGGVSGFLAQGISNALEGQTFWGGEVINADSTTAVAADTTLTPEQVTDLNKEVAEIAQKHGAEQVQFLKDTYNLTDDQTAELLKGFDANGDGMFAGNEIVQLQANLDQQFGIVIPNAEAATTMTGNWEAPFNGTLGKELPSEWTETWTKGIYSVGRGHNFAGAEFSLNGTPGVGGDHYALAKALQYMSHNVPAENMNTEEAGIMVSHLYGTLLTESGSQMSDAQIAEFAGRVAERYAGTEFDMSGLFVPGGATETITTTVTEGTSVDGLLMPWYAAVNETQSLVNTMIGENAPGVAGGVANKVGDFIVESTRKVSELGTTGALAGMGISMWAANMYTPENREFGQRTDEQKKDQGTGGNTGQGGATTGGQQTPPNNTGTPQAPTGAGQQTTEQGGPKPADNNPTNGVPGASPVQPVAATVGATNANQVPGGVGIKPLTSQGYEISTNVTTGRLIAPSQTWREQSGQLSEFALNHGKLNALRVVGAKLASGLWEASTALVRGRNPFKNQLNQEIINSVKVNNSLAVLDTKNNQVVESRFNVAGLRADEMEQAVGQQIINMKEDIRGMLKGYIKQALNIEFGNGANTLTVAEGRDQVHPSDNEALKLFLRENKDTKINDEMVDAFMNLMIILNDPNNYNQNASKLNTKGQAEFEAIAQLMLDREKQWYAILPGKASAKINTEYRGMPLVVSDAIIRSALELSGFKLTDEMRKSAQYFTNIDQMSRSAGYLDPKGGFFNALQAIRHSQEIRGGRLGTPVARVEGTPVQQVQANETDPVPPTINLVWDERATKPTGARRVIV
ncbi:MAG TPA: hypothetical protein PLV59_00350 [Candidatus Dojkabacteria bacterium]|nr:hypothetical protein [Candidatus Dojkabacteria bacterium]